MIHDFREIVLLNVTLVLRYRMVHSPQLLKDVQVELRSLYIAQLSQNKHKNASNPAGVADAVAVVVLYLLQLPKQSSQYKFLDLIDDSKNKLRYDCHDFVICEGQNKSRTESHHLIPLFES